MSDDILKPEVIDGKDVLAYSYGSLRDIDDIIIQLINESADTGFIKSSINRKEKELVFRQGSLIPLSDAGIAGDNETLLAMLRDLYGIMDFLEASFIDYDYVLASPEYIFVDKPTGKLFLTIVPVSGISAGEGKPGELARVIADSLGTGVTKDVHSLINSQAEKGINSCDEFKELILQIEKMPSSEGTSDSDMQLTPENDNGNSDNAPSSENDEHESETVAVQENDKTDVSKDSASAMEQGDAASVANEGEVSEDDASVDAGKSIKHAVFLLRRKTGEIIPLPDRDAFIIGKVPLICDYVVGNNPTLSRIHAVIRYNKDDGRYYIADCNSTNHIYLDGKRIGDSEPMPLEDKMRIHLATEEFVFNSR